MNHLFILCSILCKNQKTVLQHESGFLIHAQTSFSTGCVIIAETEWIFLLSPSNKALSAHPHFIVFLLSSKQTRLRIVCVANITVISRFRSRFYSTASFLLLLHNLQTWTQLQDLWASTASGITRASYLSQATLSISFFDKTGLRKCFRTSEDLVTPLRCDSGSKIKKSFHITSIDSNFSICQTFNRRAWER